MTPAALPALSLPAALGVDSDAERELVRSAQQRDTDAFAQLYRSHVRRIYALCLRLTANPSLAEELTQQSFVTAWQKLPLFRGESTFASWLHRLAVNAVLMAFRARSRFSAHVIFTDELDALETPIPLSAPGTRLDLEQAIAALPPKARTIFVLHDVEGWQHHEIAERLGLAIGTTKAQLHRARERLQEALQ